MPAPITTVGGALLKARFPCIDLCPTSQTPRLCQHIPGQKLRGVKDLMKFISAFHPAQVPS